MNEEKTFYSTNIAVYMMKKEGHKNKRVFIIILLIVIAGFLYGSRSEKNSQESQEKNMRIGGAYATPAECQCSVNALLPTLLKKAQQIYPNKKLETFNNCPDESAKTCPTLTCGVREVRTKTSLQQYTYKCEVR